MCKKLLNTDSKKRITELPGWTIESSLDTRNYVNPLYNTTLVQPKNVCIKNGQQIFLLIIVCSSIDNHQYRNSIR